MNTNKGEKNRKIFRFKNKQQTNNITNNHISNNYKIKIKA